MPIYSKPRRVCIAISFLLPYTASPFVISSRYGLPWRRGGLSKRARSRRYRASKLSSGPLGSGQVSAAAALTP